MIEIQEWVMVILSFLSMCSFLGRAYFEKHWVCLSKAVPRFLFVLVYLYFAVYLATAAPTMRTYLTRYVVVYLLTTDIIYNSGKLWSEVSLIYPGLKVFSKRVFK